MAKKNDLAVIASGQSEKLSHLQYRGNHLPLGLFLGTRTGISVQDLPVAMTDRSVWRDVVQSV